MTELTFRSGVAVVAGGSGGLGAGIAEKFARAGIPVVISYHKNLEKAEALQAQIVQSGGRCEIAQVDLAVAEQVEALFALAKTSYGGIAHAVYAAGPHFEFNYIGAIPNQDWYQVVDTDIKGAFHFIQASVRHFREQNDGGNLLALITSAVERVPVKDIMSAAPKAAIEMLIRGVAKESGRFGIRANCVAPGWINAGLGQKGLEEKLDEATREMIRKTTIPLQQFGDADDIAHAALFLCSQQAKFITGQSLAVDGGLQL